MHRVAIIGGGFAGVAAAHTLVRTVKEGEAQITLFDSQGAHGYTPLFFETIAAGMDTEMDRLQSWTGSALPFTHGGMWSRLHRVQLKREEITRVDIHQKHLFLASGEIVEFDTIILAMGATHTAERVPGANTNAIPLKTLADTARIQREVSTLSWRGGLVHVILVGGGPSSLELAAQIAWSGNRATQQGTIWKVTVIESGSFLLGNLHQRTSRLTTQRLSRLGVDIRTQYRVQRVEQGQIQAVDAAGVRQDMHADLIVWAAGIAPRPIWGEWGLPVDSVGWVCVDEQYRVEGMPGIYAVGDMVSQGGKPTPRRAPMALAQGEAAARAAVRAWRGQAAKRPSMFARWRSWPIAIPLGGRFGIAAWGPVAVGGWLGWAMRVLADAQYFFTVLSARQAWQRLRHGARATSAPKDSTV